MNLPEHIAIIMDGNGRWAQERGLPRTEGHRAGADVVDTVTTHCRQLGIRFLTLYTFSKENWNRPDSEVTFLFDLLVRFTNEQTPKMLKNDIRFNIYGNVDGLPIPAKMAVNRAIKATEKCSAMTLNLALNYSGRDEIAHAVRRLMADNVPAENVTEQLLAMYLYSAGQPDPDLLIRTGGEWRLSNFLPFQSVYSELYFTDTLWPDFTPTELDKAIEWYRGRERRFGMTSQQVKEQA